jgi:hypothetical protein
MLATRQPVVATSLHSWGHQQVGPEIEVNRLPTSFEYSNKQQQQQVSRQSSSVKKTVRFSDSNEVCPVQHLDEYTDDELSAIWYDSDDYGEIKNSYQHTIMLMECSKTFPEGEHTSRGLEYRTQKGAWARYENKRAAYGAVLDEQDNQWSKNKDDHDEIARVYIEHTIKSAKAAYAVALSDARAAREVYESFFWGQSASSPQDSKDSANTWRWSKMKSFGQMFSSRRVLST